MANASELRTGLVQVRRLTFRCLRLSPPPCYCTPTFRLSTWHFRQTSPPRLNTNSTASAPFPDRPHLDVGLAGWRQSGLAKPLAGLDSSDHMQYPYRVTGLNAMLGLIARSSRVTFNPLFGTAVRGDGRMTTAHSWGLGGEHFASGELQVQLLAAHHRRTPFKGIAPALSGCESYLVFPIWAFQHVLPPTSVSIHPSTQHFAVWHPKRQMVVLRVFTAELIKHPMSLLDAAL